MILLKRKYLNNFYPVLANGIPKSGTHLLENFLKNAICLIRKTGGHYYNYRSEGNKFTLSELIDLLSGLNKGEYIMGHFTLTDEIREAIILNNIRSILIIRDPRDLVVSHVNHALKLSNYRLHDLYKGVSTEEQINFTIFGVDDLLSPNGIGNPNIKDRFMGFLEWMEEPYNITIKYEDLIGQKGGGSDIKQEQLTDYILDHICIRSEKARVNRNKIYNTDSVTFNKGTISQWEETFTENNKNNFKKIAGDLLIELGYEKDLNW